MNSHTSKDEAVDMSSPDFEQQAICAYKVMREINKKACVIAEDAIGGLYDGREQSVERAFALALVTVKAAEMLNNTLVWHDLGPANNLRDMITQLKELETALAGSVARKAVDELELRTLLERNAPKQLAV